MAIIDGNVIEATDVTPFGDRTDGVFNETSGTTNLVQGVVHQYSSFNLGASATLSASSTSEKPIIILVDGNCTIDGTIDLIGKGWPRYSCGANKGYAAFSGVISGLDTFGWGTVGETGGTGGSGGRRGMKSWNFQELQSGFIMNGLGGADAAGTSAGIGVAGGATLYMLIRGTLTFGASSTIDVSGANGENGSATGGGGGGGGSGDIIIIVNGAITDNGVTKTKNGGTGGTATGSVGGGGGGSSISDGGGASNNGGNGAAGNEVIVAYDTILWGGKGPYPAD